MIAVPGIQALRVGDGAGTTEAGQHVDMTVGIVAFQFTVVEPEDPVDPEQVPEQAFQSVPAFPGVAPAVNEAA